MTYQFLEFLRRLMTRLLWDDLLHPFIVDLLYGGIDGGFNFGKLARILVYTVLIVSFIHAGYNTTHLSKEEKELFAPEKKKDA